MRFFFFEFTIKNKKKKFKLNNWEEGFRVFLFQIQRDIKRGTYNSTSPEEEMFEKQVEIGG